MTLQRFYIDPALSDAEIAELLRRMAVAAEVAKHGNHDQSSHGNWARSAGTDRLSFVAVDDVIVLPGSLGLDRADMPQIPGDHSEAFFDLLRADGISITSRRVPAASLKPIQHHISRSRTDHSKQGITDRVPKLMNRPLLTSQDGYILDGHHRWAAFAELGEEVPITEVGLDVRELLLRAREFNADQGIEARSLEYLVKRLDTALAKHGSHDQSTHGNWARGLRSVSGARLPPGEDPELVQRVFTENLERYGARLDHIFSVAPTSANSTPTKRGIDTMGMYSNWGEDGTWQGWTEERLAWQTETLDRMMEQQALFGGAPKRNREAIVMAGLPGAGKTYLLQNKLGDTLNLEDYVVVNADDIKHEIIRSGSPPQVSDLEGLELASLVHEESSDMAKRWERSLVVEGYNIALDITAANQAKTSRKIRELIDQGYTVHVVHADISIDESLASTLRRAGEGSATPGKLGRPVPPAFIRSMAASAGRDSIDVGFTEYAEIANGSVYHYRNYPLSFQEPQLVYSRGPK